MKHPLTARRTILRRRCKTLILIGVTTYVATQPTAASDGSASPQGTLVSTALDLPEGTLVGITTPARRATLASVRPARVQRLLTPEGGRVEAGDVVVELDAAVQRARVEIARAAAESTLAVELARTEWQRTLRELKRLERLHSDASATIKELEDARALMETRRLEYELAEFNHKQAVRAYERERAMLEEHFLRAPFAGRVVEHLKQEGETVDPLEGIVVLAQLHPLRVAVDCPLALAGVIAKGASFPVAPIGVARAPRTGTVVYVSPVADTGSQTFRVKLEVANEEDAWLAGMKVAVTFVSPRNGRASSAPSTDSDGAPTHRPLPDSSNLPPW